MIEFLWNLTLLGVFMTFGFPFLIIGIAVIYKFIVLIIELIIGIIEYIKEEIK